MFIEDSVGGHIHAKVMNLGDPANTTQMFNQQLLEKKSLAPWRHEFEVPHAVRPLKHQGEREPLDVQARHHLMPPGRGGGLGSTWQGKITQGNNTEMVLTLMTLWPLINVSISMSF